MGSSRLVTDRRARPALASQFSLPACSCQAASPMLACRVWLPRRSNRPATRDAGALGWATVRSLGSLAESVRDGLELPGKPVNWQSAFCPLLGCGAPSDYWASIALRYQLLDQVMRASDLRAQYNMPVECA